MSISNKIKAILKLKNKTSVDLSKELDLSNAIALNTKYSRESFKVQELIKIAEFTGCDLCLIDKNTGETLIKFNMEDIKKDTE